MFIIFYGPEGSGKSTQAKMLAQKLNLPYLGSGDLVRKYSAEDKGLIGEICREALSIGHYVADSEMFVLWKGRLKEDDVQQGFVIDGFPRNLTQALFLAEKIDKYGKTVNHVFYLTVSEEETIKRLSKRGRINPDGSNHDTPEKILSRLKMYHDQEEDVLNFYKEQNLITEINGEQSVEAIHQDILKIIETSSNE